MLQRYKGIVLCSFKYNDTKNIAHVFTLRCILFVKPGFGMYSVHSHIIRISPE